MPVSRKLGVYCCDQGWPATEEWIGLGKIHGRTARTATDWEIDRGTRRRRVGYSSAIRCNRLFSLHPAYMVLASSSSTWAEPLRLLGQTQTQLPNRAQQGKPKDMFPLLVVELSLSVVAEFLLSSREDDTRSWGNFLVYFSHKLTQMPCQHEGLGIHIYRLLASQAYAKMLV